MGGSTKPKLGFLEAVAHGLKAGLPAAKQAAKVAYEQGRERQNGSKIEPTIQSSHITSNQPQTTVPEDVRQYQYVQNLSHAPQSSPGFPSTHNASNGDCAHFPTAPMHAFATGPSPPHPRTARSGDSFVDPYGHATETTFRQDAMSFGAQ